MTSHCYFVEFAVCFPDCVLQLFMVAKRHLLTRVHRHTQSVAVEPMFQSTWTDIHVIASPYPLCKNNMLVLIIMHLVIHVIFIPWVKYHLLSEDHYLFWCNMKAWWWQVDNYDAVYQMVFVLSKQDITINTTTHTTWPLLLSWGHTKHNNNGPELRNNWLQQGWQRQSVCSQVALDPWPIFC